MVRNLIVVTSETTPEQDRRYQLPPPPPRYEVACLPDLERQRQKLESLRYRFRYAHAVDLQWRTIQRLGNIGRQLAPWLVALKAWR